MTTYVPDPRAYLQLRHGDPYGGYNCTAWGAAFRVDAHSKGATKTTGIAVRSHSDEPRPDPSSPGLNLGQVDESVKVITHDKIDFDTRVQGRSLPRGDVQWRVRDGRFCGLSVDRGVFVRRGFLEGFTGAHDVTLFTRDTEPNQPLLFDPLVPTITRVSWDVAFDAAESLTGGYVYAQFTRDLTPDYHWVLEPKAPATVRVMNHFIVRNIGGFNRIVRIEKVTTRGTDVKCTPPRFIRGKAGAPDYWDRYLVQLIAPGHARDGWYVDARWAEELNP